MILTREGDTSFQKQINEALQTLIENRELEKILRSYGLWNEDQERLNHWRLKRWGDQKLSDEQQLTGTTPIDWPLAFRLLRDGALMTIFLAVMAMPLPPPLGVLKLTTDDSLNIRIEVQDDVRVSSVDLELDGQIIGGAVGTHLTASGPVQVKLLLYHNCNFHFLVHVLY